VLNPDYQDILSIFNEQGVEYLVVGAYALAAHGLPRATGDIDLWIRRSDENARQVWQSLARFGAPLTDLSRGDLVTPDIVFQIGVAPRRIDILTSIAALEFDEAWEHRKVVEVEGLQIPVLSREDLLKNKKALRREKDLGDIAWLERRRS